MSVQLEIKPAPANHIVSQLKRLSLSLPIFLSWKQALEYNLSEDPHGCLEFVHGGRESFHEYRGTEIVGKRKFDVIWEIEWDRSAGRFHLLQATIYEVTPPNLHADP